MKVGVIGGSGVYDLEGLQDMSTRVVETPVGKPSDAFVCGRLHGVEVFFLPRHGRGHKLLPAEINHRANIYAFKTLGVERIVSISAVGSLKAELRPRDVVLPDQYFDRTKRSLEHTFFGQGLVAHVAFGEPTCPELRRILAVTARQVMLRSDETRGLRLQDGGTYVNMEGPAFSTKAESHTYRKMDFDVIGMTSLGEAKLCREAEICYQALAMVTDYDCWHESEAPVTVEMVVGHLMANTRLGKDILVDALRQMPAVRGCGCGKALADAILTDRKAIPDETRKRLAPIIGKYV